MKNHTPEVVPPGAAPVDIEKALKPYSDNLPYNRNRVIVEAQSFLDLAGRAIYELGKRLVLLREYEGDETFKEILENHFPDLCRRNAYYYVSFVEKTTQLPKLREFAEHKGNFSKCLELLTAYDEDELAVLDAGEPIAGRTLDDVAKMPVRVLRKTLRSQKEKHDKEKTYLEGDVAELRVKNQDLKTELKELESGTQTPEFYLSQIKKASRHITEAIKIVTALPDNVIGENFDLQIEVNKAWSSLDTMVKNVDLKIRDAIGD